MSLDNHDIVKQAQQLTGMEFFQVIGDGRLPYPPLLQTLAFKVESIQEEETVFSFHPQPFHYNSVGTVHGGVIAAILDTAMGCAVHARLAAGMIYTTLELKTNFLKAVTLQSGELRAVGKVVHFGGRTALAEAKLIDSRNKLFAHGVSTCLIFKTNQTQHS